MKNLSPRDMVLVSMFAGLAAVGALIFRWLGAALVVPFSIVPFVVVLAGCMLGPRLGAMSMLLYMLLGLVGIPVYEKYPFGTPAYVFEPTFGFILGFVAAAYVTGLIAQGKDAPGLARYIVATLVGTVVLYSIGLPYLYLILNFYTGDSLPVMKLLAVGFIPFIGWDVLKAVVAASLARAVEMRLYPGKFKKPGIDV